MSPEYQRSIGGSQVTPQNATIAWPATRRTKSASRVQSRAITERRKPGSLVPEEHPLVVTVPLALEELVWIVLALELEEFLHLRIAGVDLAAQGEAVVGGVVAAAVTQAEVDQPPQRVGAADHAARGVLDVQVEDDAGVGLARPGEEALAVLLDQAHGAVDDVPGVAPGVFAHLVHEGLERLALDVDLGDRLGPLVRGVGHAIDGAVVLLGVEAHLALVGPVELPIGGRVVRGVALEGLALVRVREEQQLGP